MTDRITQVRAQRDALAATLVEVQRELQAARAEVEWLRNRNGCLEGIIDDIQVETGHCRFLDDEEHEPPHLPDHVRAIVQERDEARAEVERLRAEVAATDAVISDRGVSEYDCRLPLAERVDNLLVALKECRFQFATTAMENEQLRADLREAMELLAQVDDGQVPHDTWLDARNALLEKHKETNQ